MERKRQRHEIGGYDEGVIPAASGWLEAGHLLGPGFRLVFTDRMGGVSKPPFHELNLAFHTGDDPLKVAENRAILARAIGLEENRVFYPHQAHGLDVAWLETASLKPLACDEDLLKEKDGLVCDQSGLALSVLTADCAPLALAYPKHGILAMLHAGWRGTLGDIVSAACGMIEELSGAQPSDARAVIGPCIGPCCYEVDEGRARLFVEKYEGEEVVVRREGGWRLDLRKANILNMKRCGMVESAIHLVGGCTCCDPRYFSFRRERVTGRQGAFLWREER